MGPPRLDIYREAGRPDRHRSNIWRRRRLNSNQIAFQRPQLLVSRIERGAGACGRAPGRHRRRPT